MEEKQNFFEDKVEVGAKKLKNIAETLRSPQGCPWDRKLKIEDCAEYILEETYEAIEAIDNNDSEGLLEELGDILSQVFMISQIASEQNLFDISDVFNNICQKLIFRHPHVFKDEKADSAEDVLKIWNRQKLIEKSKRKNIIEGIPKNLPSIYILIKLFRKIKQHPEIFQKIKDSVCSSFENIKNQKEQFFQNIDKEFDKNIDKNIDQQDLSMDKESYSNIISDFLYLIIFISFLYEIDPEKLLRKKIENIYKIFEDNEKNTKK
jgi:tetrapyrrole methylase family protein/MazG family protein